MIDKWVYGGREKVVENLARYIKREEFYIEVLVLENIAEKLDNTRQKKLIPNINFYFIKYKNRINLLFSLINFFKKNKYDIILTTIFPSFVLFFYIAKKIASLNSKIIISIHGFFKVKNPLSKILTPYIFKKSSLVITVSKGLEKYVEEKFKVSKEKVITIYSPIFSKENFNISFPTPPEYKKFKNYQKIITIARLDLKSKDFKTLFKAFKLVKEKVKKIKLFILGDGPDYENIKKLAEQLNILKDIIFLGAKDNPFWYLKYSDVFVLSSFYEGLPVTILEAFICRCLVVATDCPFGPREILGKSKNGLLVPCNDFRAMADSIFEILRNKKLKNFFFKNNKKTLENFDIQNQVKKYEKVFRRIICQN